jgi:hypothetical protein
VAVAYDLSSLDEADDGGGNLAFFLLLLPAAVVSIRGTKERG